MNLKLATGLLILLSASLLHGQVNLSQSLTACYALNANGTEAINNLTATLSAITPALDRFNNPSSALAFNGTSSSFLELPDNPLLKPTNAFSFSCWLKTSIIADQYILMTKNPASSNFESYDLHLGNVAGQLRIRAKKGDGSSGTTEITGTTNLSINTWYHFAVTVDNTNIRVYTNGVLDASAVITFPFSYQANKTVILGGSNEPSFNLPFTGSLDNLRFYNRAINASEVNQLYLTDPACIDVTSVISFPDAKNELKIFPNPSSGTFYIKCDKDDEIKLINTLGQTLKAFSVKAGEVFEVNEVPEGIYFIIGKSENGKWQKKVIVNK